MKISLSILILFLMVSCSSNSKIKIGFLIPNLIDERSTIEQKYFVTKMNELGGEPMTAEAKNNDQLQIEQAKQMISDGVKILVIMPVNKNTSGAIVRYAHSKGVKVIAYERIISNCDLDYYVSFDNVKVGELMAAYALKQKPEGSYLIFSGDKSDQNAVWVKEGQMKILDPYIKSGKIKIQFDGFIEDWSGDNACNLFEKYLSLREMQIPDVILSAYDGMSQGIVRALEENDVKNYPVITGQNAELLSCKYIVQGKQSMTVYKSLRSEVEKAVDLAMQIAGGNKVSADKTIFNGSSQVPSILIDPVMVDASNIKNTVIQDGFLKEEDIFGKN